MKRLLSGVILGSALLLGGCTSMASTAFTNANKELMSF
jgi:hypothetical protein